MDGWMDEWMDGCGDGSYNEYLFIWLSSIPSWEGTITIKTFSPLRNVSLCAFLGTGKQLGPNSLHFHSGKFRSRHLTSAWPVGQSFTALGIWVSAVGCGGFEGNHHLHSRGGLWIYEWTCSYWETHSGSRCLALQKLLGLGLFSKPVSAACLVLS